MISEYIKIAILANKTISDALKQMDTIKRKLLIVLNDDDSFLSLVSIGDLQRAIIANKPLDTLIKDIIREDVRVAYVGDDLEAVKNRMRIKRNEFMPIINDKGIIIDVIYWENLFKNEIRRKQKSLKIPVVIMAGGKGNRLKPLTNIIPKPLIPIDEQTIAEHIIENFQKIGCNRFFMSINYKSKMIKEYFQDKQQTYSLDFFEEDKPLGTAGSLHLLHGKIESTFFISNCDVLINDDYNEIYDYHKRYNNELTIVASYRHYEVPYGTLETCEEGQLVSLQEKPKLNFLINSGMYILEPHLLTEIPKDTFFHITDLIKQITERGGRVGVFPVSEKSWIDIGEWDKYLERIKISIKN